MTTFDPPYAPLGAGAARIQRGKKRKVDDIAGEEYTSGDFDAPKDDPDSPGLELFYTKDVFGVERDGKPRWCSECCIWKLDRQHHCSVVGRWRICQPPVRCRSRTVSHPALPVTQFVPDNVSRAAFFGLFTGTMFLSSVRLAINNLTQIEDISRSGKIHRLAILKPSPQRLAEISVMAASTQTYSEITYPLDIPFLSDSTRVNRPYAKTIRHDRLSEPISLQDAIRMAGLKGMPTDAAIETVDETSHFKNLPSESTQAGIDSSSNTVLQSQNIDTVTIDELQSPIESFERLNRDQRAVRTFAILETTAPGDNPWDLGSALLNWETVMGEHFIDWVFPVKRSPCCNHEHMESHFSIGPAVDRIRASVCFILPNEVRPEGRHRRKRPNQPKEDLANQSGRRFSPKVKEMERKTDETELRDLHTRNSRHR
ncbi:palmitoyltransferase pfa5 [Ciborinia camelliae]|nr:palmitoyltransferase pfa5 [Ciborinia camelliae]